MSHKKFLIITVVLIVVLVMTTFYMAFVHVPYHQYHNNLNLIRNEICETNNYEYDDYFYAHHGDSVYYILRIKMNNEQYYVAYDTDKKLVSSLKAPFANEDDVIRLINERYETNIDDLDVGYENNKFVYYKKIQDEIRLTYVYYSLETGEFLKAYYIED